MWIGEAKGIFEEYVNDYKQYSNMLAALTRMRQV